MKKIVVGSLCIKFIIRGEICLLFLWSFTFPSMTSPAKKQRPFVRIRVDYVHAKRMPCGIRWDEMVPSIFILGCCNWKNLCYFSLRYDSISARSLVSQREGLDTGCLNRSQQSCQGARRGVVTKMTLCSFIFPAGDRSVGRRIQFLLSGYTQWRWSWYEGNVIKT